MPSGIPNDSLEIQRRLAHSQYTAGFVKRKHSQALLHLTLVHCLTSQQNGSHWQPS